MAGESPDKSEQRKSPGETAAGGRDPRLAAFGDARPGARPAGVDQPTAVFKAPKVSEPERDASDVSDASEPSEAPEPSDAPDTPGTPDAPGTPDSPKASETPEEPAGERTAAAGRAAAGGATVPEAREPSDSATAATAATTDSADTADAPEAPAAPAATDDADDEPASSAKAPEAPEAPEATVKAEPAADARHGGGDDGGDGDGDDGADGEADRDDAEGDDEREAPAPAADTGRGVDQATAVFGTVRRPAGPVDQPTTALKTLAPRPTAASGKSPSGAPATSEAPADKAPADKAPAGKAPADEGADEAPAGRTAPRWATGAARDTSARDTADADSGADAGSDSGTGRGDGDSDGRPSTFVPLRSDDVRPAASKRPTGSTGTTAPAASTPATASTPAAASTPPAESTSAGAKPSGSASGAQPRAAATNDVTAETPAPSASLTEAERTRQQPMPPLPPLDLLAELTNTPPPPETPVRTLVRRVKIWSPLVLLLAIIFAVAQMLRPLPDPSLTLSADPTYTFGGGKLAMPWPTEGQGAVEVEGVGLIGTYGPQKPAPMASVAKTMTAYVLLRDHPIKDKDAGPKIEIDQLTEEQAKNPDWSVAPVKKGQVYTQGELIQLLMIRSANNVAHLLARWDAGSEEAFIKKMNTTAKQLGMTNTTYTDASGFDKGTVSTPIDQLKLAKAAMKDPAFREIVDMPNVTLPQIGKRLENGNTLLIQPGISGVKTGTSTPAGGNLLWSANTVVDGKVRRVLGVVMNVKSPALLSEKTKLAVETFSRDLIRAAQEGVTSAAVVKKGDVVGYVDDGLGGRTPVIATKELKPVGWAGLEVDLILTDGGKAVPHTAAEGTVVGELAVGSGEGRVSVPVALQKDLAEPGFGAKLTRIG
ncbi:D-alanyl-D-alanine carboxypeptidase [Streptomyces sp. DH12]|uniref:D-alanyl-D-alanine carboxypeptidase n=1 Tax=Streptomyces sp. DH12 TaxID=2857010 RepID=UPI001E5DBB63|nr:D-alanyl-D-alanine carboxypeptidase [Streptomyces sp. DH12]